MTTKAVSDAARYRARKIAEKVLGKSLPSGVIVHHADGNETNNDSNLVICENEAYHKLLHQRTNALRACGHANWRKCVHCGKYDDLSNLRIYKTSNTSCEVVRHPACYREYIREYMREYSKKGER